MGCTWKCWGSWMMSSQDQSWKSLISHGNQERYLKTEANQRPLLFSKDLEGQPREWQNSQPHLSLWEGNGSGTSRYMKVKVTKSNQHQFINGESCCTNLINFYDKVNVLVEEVRAVDTVYLDFRKALSPIKGIISNKSPTRVAHEVWAGWSDCEVDWELRHL